MNEIEPNLKGMLILFIYCIVGLPVVWLHIRQQKMIESISQIQFIKAQGLVLITLALMWPVLLFALTLHHFQRKKPPQKSLEKNES